MKNYFRQILSSFTKNQYPESVRRNVYEWLTDSEHAVEKNNALQEIWEETRTMGTVPHVEQELERWKRNNGLQVPSPHTLAYDIIPASAIRGKLRILRFWQSAAAILLLAVGSLTYLVMQAEKPDIDLVQAFIPTAEMRQLHLPDGSQVQLNSRSTLLYPKEFTGKERAVYLIGEANFKVKPDKEHPFIVKSNDFQVTALGTEFNVNAYPENLEVSTALLSGSVLVEWENLTQSTVLQPDEQFTYNREKGLSCVEHPEMADVTAWQRGELVFYEMTVKDIIQVLERKYNYAFVYSLSSLSNDRLSFRFKDKAPLAEVMDIIVDVAGNLKFRIEGDVCYITRKQK